VDVVTNRPIAAGSTSSARYGLEDMPALLAQPVEAQRKVL